jgi:hypothetical protein
MLNIDVELAMRRISDDLFIARLRSGILVYLSVFLLLLQATPPATAQSDTSPFLTVNILQLPDGVEVEETIISGPPTPPPGFAIERQAVSLPEPDAAAGTNVLTVPAFNWVFGCSAVSGAMIAGYYDRSGWSNIYTGPTNGGVMPLDNSSWPTWSDGHTSYPNCPLIASKSGVDGRTSRGSIDDYWIEYGSSAPDPYLTNGWTQHAWEDAIGDYMMTSQSEFGNTDGSTTFWGWVDSPEPLTCADMEAWELADGSLGRKHFYEARGYTVTDCYNQKTDNTIAGGFSFSQFKAEIDAGRPVMLNLAGHTIVGVGYDDATNLVYLHDTWDYSNHTMTWGTSYAGLALMSVSIVNMSAGNPVNPPSDLTATAASSSQINLSWADNSDNESGFSIERKSGAAGTWSEIATTAANTTSYANTGLAASSVYYYRARAYNATETSGYSNEANATTLGQTKTLSSLAISGPNRVNESSTTTYTATATFSDGTSAAVTPAWSENSTFAAITSGGVLTTTSVTSNRTVTITARYTYEGITKSASKAVTIVNVTKTLSSLAISGPSRVNERSSATYSGTARFSDGTSAAVTPAWSENSTFASITSGGVLTTTSVPGNRTVTITARYTYGGITKSATKTVTIVNVAPAMLPD